MRLIKRLLLTIALFIIVLAVGSFFLPQKQQVERTVEISAPANVIYPHLANPQLFVKWSPWSSIDPNMKTEFTGAESGEGAGMSWQSAQPSVGTGSWLITKAVENESLDVNMDFAGQGTATSFFTLKPSGSNTAVTWGFETNAGMNPVMRWMGLMMDKMVGSEYEKGLLKLKGIVEKQ